MWSSDKTDNITGQWATNAECKLIFCVCFWVKYCTSRYPHVSLKNISSVPEADIQEALRNASKGGHSLYKNEQKTISVVSGEIISSFTSGCNQLQQPHSGQNMVQTCYGEFWSYTAARDTAVCGNIKHIFHFNTFLSAQVKVIKGQVLKVSFSESDVATLTPG